jgi:hypothetical protein
MKGFQVIKVLVRSLNIIAAKLITFLYHTTCTNDKWETMTAQGLTAKSQVSGVEAASEEPITTWEATEADGAELTSTLCAAEVSKCATISNK